MAMYKHLSADSDVHVLTFVNKFRTVSLGGNNMEYETFCCYEEKKRLVLHVVLDCVT